MRESSISLIARVLGRPRQVVLAFPPNLVHVVLRRLEVGGRPPRASGSVGPRSGVALYPAGADVDLRLIHRVPVRRNGGLLRERQVALVLVDLALVRLVRHFGLCQSDAPRNGNC